MGTSFKKTGIILSTGTDINENLCVDSTKDYGASHTTYIIANYNLSESLVADQKYTISAKINATEEKKSVGFYLSGGTSKLVGWLSINEDGLYIGTFTATTAHATNTAGDGHGFVRVYVSNNVGGQGSTELSGTANVDWIKVEVGEIATPWTQNSLDYGFITPSNHGFIEGGNLMRVFDGCIETQEFIEY